MQILQHHSTRLFVEVCSDEAAPSDSVFQSKLQHPQDHAPPSPSLCLWQFRVIFCRLTQASMCGLPTIAACLASYAPTKGFDATCCKNCWFGAGSGASSDLPCAAVACKPLATLRCFRASVRGAYDADLLALHPEPACKFLVGLYTRSPENQKNATKDLHQGGCPRKAIAQTCCTVSEPCRALAAQIEALGRELSRQEIVHCAWKTWWARHKAALPGPQK